MKIKNNTDEVIKAPFGALGASDNEFQLQ